MRHFKLLGFLLARSRSLAVALLAAGALSGLFSAGILAVVNRALHERDGIAALLIAAFVALAAGKVVAAAAAQLLLVRFSQTNLLELSLDLCGRILAAPLRLIERRGAAQILATLTDDVSAVAWAVRTLPQLAMNVFVVLGCALYLAWLSWPMLLAVLGIALAGVAAYQRLHSRAVTTLHAARTTRSQLFRHFATLTGGIKELLLHRRRRASFLDELRSTAEEYRRGNYAATVHYALADAWVTTLYYGLIGLAVFGFPLFASASPEVLTGYAFTMLYMMTPLWAIMSALPAVGQGQVALAKLEELGMSVDSAAAPNEPRGELPAEAASVELRGVRFAYEDAPESGRAGFALGPLDFRLARGELVFVIGGNGSGKSTFAKVLTGLYWPAAGTLAIDGVAITREQQEAYRERFSAVFTDFHLFDNLAGLAVQNLEATAQRYLGWLELESKVELRNGRLSTLDLSQGQRKRLALLTAYLEDRPFYLFDEWAADQDPDYKQVFYARLLPELRARGKGVVVITHDDRYFSLGDRVVRLEDGQISAAAAERRVEAVQ